MRSRVTAVLVAREGGEWLERTVAALAAQTRPPDAIVAVNNGGAERVAHELAMSGAARVVSLSGSVPFGAAVKHGIDVSAPAGAVPGASPDAGPSSAAETTVPEGRAVPDEWLWLLTEDSAPEPEALARILATVQRAPSVALAGPKLVDWDHPERIIELGQSLTRYGSRWLLRRQELDQQQYDHLQDVLGVGPVGMLVRRDVWEQLGGFDPALPVYDDGLDLSVRARLAGYRVVVAPGSRIRFARSGVAGPRIDRRRSVLRAAHREARASHLHRRIAYAPAPAAILMWLGLPLLGLLRVLWSLIREQPGHMLGELAAALRVFLHPARLVASRRRIRAHSDTGFSAIRPLRIDPKSVRTARMIDREAILAAEGRQPRELHFVASGGLAVLIAAAVAAVAFAWWAVPHTSLGGGGMAPLSSIGELWSHTRSIGGVPADPFAWVLAALGSLTFWAPSHAVVLVLVAAIPLSALGGWIWAAQLTDSSAGRALLGLGWALSPVLLGSLASGRLSTLVLAVVLPWLLVTAARCRESWSFAGAASLAAAVALACAPVLIPAALVLLLVGLASSVRGITRVLATAIAPLALFAPKILLIASTGRPLDLLLDPGLTPAYRAGTPWQLMLGFPEFGLEGWGGIVDALGLGDAPATLLVGVLFLPVVLLAMLGLVTGRVSVTVLHALLAGLGLLTALLASRLQLMPQGAESVAVWTGSGLALYWIAILGLAAVGGGALRRAAAPLVSVALVAALVAVAPLAVRLATAQTPLRDGEAQMPALVEAAGLVDPDLRTLVLTAEGGAAVRAELVTGTGLRLDQVRTAERAGELGAADEQLAELVGRLASTGDHAALDAQLAQTGVDFVLLRAGGQSEGATLQAAFDQHASLASVGLTAHGLLWRAQAGQSEPDESAEARSSDGVPGTGLSGLTIWWAQLALLFGMFLLALPTGEVVERPERRRRPARRRRGAAEPLDTQTAEPPASDPVDPQTAEPPASDPVDPQTSESPAPDPEDAR